MQRKDGGLVLVAALNYVFRTKQVSDVLNGMEPEIAKMSGVKGKEVWITGKMEGTFRKVFEAKSWKVTENANDKILKK